MGLESILLQGGNLDIGSIIELGTSSIVSIVAILAVLWFFRKPLKAFFTAFFGYQKDFDDYSISLHNNKAIIHQNKVALLKTGINLKNGLLLLVLVPSALIHPLLLGVLLVKYSYSTGKEKFDKIKTYRFYSKFDSNDKFIDFLNTQNDRIDFVARHINFTSYLIIEAGLYFHNYILTFVGLFALFVLSIAHIVIVWNAHMYKINHKIVDYFQIMRIVENSFLNSPVSAFVLLSFSWQSLLWGMSLFPLVAIPIAVLTIFLSLLTSMELRKEDSIHFQHEEIENRDYSNLHNIASYPNPISQSRGYKFSTLLQMKFFELDKKAKEKDLIHIDNYAFFPQMVNRSSLQLNPHLKESLLKTVSVAFETLDFTKQILILGGMGSGKTELVNYIVEQVHNTNFSNFKVIAFNDIKGDFTEKFYRPEKDIILNLYDERATLWCPFLEMNHNIEAGTAFLTNLFESIAGKEKDFFSGRAKQLSSQWLQESYFATKNNIEAWEMFFEKIKAYEEELREQDDKTKSSILQTIQIALEILTIMHYQIVVERRKTFTFTDFVNQKDVQLFFVNNKQYEAKLTPYLNGLTATYVNTVMAKEDTKDHLILNVFDEFLTMKIDDATRKTLLTATRSKGFSNILMAQYLINDEKMIQDLDSSRYALITFNVNDDFTLGKITKKLSDAEYMAVSSSPKKPDSKTAGGLGSALSFFGEVMNSDDGEGKSFSLSNTKILLEQQLQSMPAYHHITFIPSEEIKTLPSGLAKSFFRLMIFGYDSLMKNLTKSSDFFERESGILYLGYTPQAKLSYDNEAFEKWDMKGYYSFNAKKEDADKGYFIDEKEEFKHYMNIKFAETVENAKEYIKANNLEKYDINKMFENVEEDSQKVLQLIERYSEMERYELMEEFFAIPAADLDAKYEFAKKHDLIGGILGLFTFSKSFKDSIINKTTPVEDKV